jgi:hypothetical protein
MLHMICTVGLGQVNTSRSGQNAQNLRIFHKIRNNVILSGQNGNFNLKFNDHKDVADKMGSPILSAWRIPTVVFVWYFLCT